MSTIMKVNFEPVSDYIPLQTRDFGLADPNLSDPLNALALTDGEWMTIDANYKLVRAATIASPGNRAAVRSFPLFAERGRTDTRALADVKFPVIFIGQYEFDTRIYDASVALGSGAAITTVMQPLKVATITVSSAGRNFVGLVGHGGSADSDPIVGYVTRLPSANSGKLRFLSGWRS